MIHFYRKILLLLLFVAVPLSIIIAQNIDSVAFANAQWTVQQLKRGVKLYTFHFQNKTLFNANENISFVEVKRRLWRPRLRFAAEPKLLKITGRFSDSLKAVASVNGNFFDVKDGGAVDFVMVDGKTVNANRFSKNNVRSFNQKAAVIINSGKPAIKKWDGSANWEQRLRSKNIMVNGPLLVFEGTKEMLDTASSFNKARHPRTAFGTISRKKYIMLVVDGRHENSAGMSLFELTKVMQWLGCKSAINFDGGGSSTLWTNSNGVVNYPCDNKKWDHGGERKVANIVYVK